MKSSGKTFLRVFNIKKGEGTSIAFLMTYSFFMGLAVAFFVTVSTTLFLERFDESALPYMYMASGTISYLLWLVYARLEKSFPFPTLLIFGISFVLLSTLALTVGYLITVSKWVPFLMMTWISVFLFFTGVGFWGLAGKIFNLRQGKRLFGLISSGEVLSNMIGFFSIPYLLHFMQLKDLLNIVLLALCICVFMMIVITGMYRKSLSMQNASLINELKGKGITLFFRNKYYFLIFTLAILPMLGICFVDYNFLTQINIAFEKPEVVAGFFGIFYGIISVAEFVVKTFIAGRLIDKYGIIAGLLTLPVLLALVVLLVTLTGTFLGTAWLFFTFISLSKLIEKVGRNSINDPYFQILYQPIAAEERSFIQSRIEGIPKAMGNVLGGLVLIGFFSFWGLTTVHFHYFFFLVILVWIGVALLMYRHYRKFLKNILASNKKPENAVKARQHLSDRLHAMATAETVDIECFSVMLNSMDMIDPLRVDTMLGDLLRANSSMSKVALFEATKRKCLSLLPTIDELLANPAFIHMHNELHEARGVLFDAEKMTFEELSTIGNSTKESDRLRAARLSGYSKRYNTFKLLLPLCADECPAVRQAALVSAGKLRRKELWGAIVENLSHSLYRGHAASAIKAIGKPIVNQLDAFLSRVSNDRDVCKVIITLFKEIGGKQSIIRLRKIATFPDRDIRFQALFAMSGFNLKAEFDEIPLVKQTLEEEIEKTVWITAILLDIAEDKNTVALQEALHVEYREKKRNIFILLSMLYDASTIALIHKNIEQGGREARIYALEIIDTMVSDDIKKKIMPLFDELTWEEYIARFADIFPQHKSSVEQRLVDIINSDLFTVNVWTKACALEIMHHYTQNSKEIVRILAANIVHPNFFIAACALDALYKTDPIAFSTLTSTLISNDKERSKHINKYISAAVKGKHTFIPDRVRLLKKMPLFNAIRENILIPVATSAEEYVMHPGDAIPLTILDEKSIVVVGKGSIDFLSNDQQYIRLGSGNIIGEFSQLCCSLREIRYRISDNTILFKLNMALLFEQISDNIEQFVDMVTDMAHKRAAIQLQSGLPNV
ncbi:MAG: hypothetical protein JW913_20725 [Chitinispirillaceae bacterium]|nr:hypothetical protein [Chitinispirillaceae bacterium]